jgi:hypothetical protein
VEEAKADHGYHLGSEAAMVPMAPQAVALGFSKSTFMLFGVDD